MKYCVYLTVYFGDKLPRRYIGSSSINKILLGYNGTIRSKKYSKLYKYEQKYNKHLFKTKILSKHISRNEALEKELFLHIKYNVVKSHKYANESLASINGFFGKNNFGENHPMFNKKHSEISKIKISNSLKTSYKEGLMISPFSKMDFSGNKNPFYGKTHSEQTKIKMRKPKKFVPKFNCPYCEIIMDAGNLKQHIKRKHNERIN